MGLGNFSHLHIAIKVVVYFFPYMGNTHQDIGFIDGAAPNDDGSKVKEFVSLPPPQLGFELLASSTDQMS